MKTGINLVLFTISSIKCVVLLVLDTVRVSSAIVQSRVPYAWLAVVASLAVLKNLVGVMGMPSNVHTHFFNLHMQT